MLPNVRTIQSEGDDERIRVAVLVAAAPLEEFMDPAFASSQPLQHLSNSWQLVRESDRNVLFLHSSGTTGRTKTLIYTCPATLTSIRSGLPKAIPLAHRYLLGHSACHSFSPHEDEYSRGVNLSTLPLYHVCSSSGCSRHASLMFF